MLVIYWAKNEKTNETIMFSLNSAFFDIGDTYIKNGVTFKIIDLTVDHPIGCAELKEARYF